MRLHGRSFVVALLSFAAVVGFASAGVAGPGPDLVVTSITAPPTASEAASVSITWTVQNQGSAPAVGPWNDNVLISADGAVGSDLFIGAFARAGTLAPGESYTQTQTVMLPQGIFGPAFIVVTTDSGNSVPEGPAGEANNSAIDDAAITITPAFPDVVIDAASISAPSMPNPGSTITVGWTVRNQGGVPADWQALFTTPTWRIALSDDTIAGDADDVVLSNFSLAIPGGNVLSPGESQVMSQNVTLPQTTTGMRYIVLTCDRNNQINEGPAGELNNVSVDLDVMEITANFPDLVVTAIDVTPVPNLWGRPVTITWTVQNQGTAPATGGSWTDQLRVSADATPSISTDIFVQNLTRPTGAATLAPGATYTLSTTLLYTAFLSDISYFFVAADISGDLGEGPTGEANNITIDEGVALLNPDVVIDAASIVAPSTPDAGATIAVQWTVRNAGQGYANWQDLFTTPTWSISLSDDTIAGDADDVILSNFSVAIPGGNTLDPGESQMMTQNVALPAGVSGMRYVIVRCDRNNSIPEGAAGEANNIVIDADAINIQANFPDLVVTAIDVTPVPNLWGRPVTITWTVQNQGTAPATGGSWTDQLRVSADATPSISTDIFVQNLTRPTAAATLAPGATYTLSTTLPYTASLSGISYFFVATDISNDLGEGPTGEANNITIDEGVELLNPDVVIDAASIVAPSAPNPGSTITVGWTVRNAGQGYANWQDLFTTPTWRIALSDDTIAGDADDVVLSNFSLAIPGGNTLDPGESQMMTQNVTLPPTTTGLRYIVLNCDRNNNIPEGTAGEANNTAVDAEPIDIPANFPDLVVTAIDVTPVPNLWGRPVTITWTVQNQGTAPATGGSWTDQLRVSADATPSISSDIFVQNLTRPAAAATIAPGATYTLSTTVNYTAFLSGISYFFVATDISNDLGEGPTGEANNTTIDEGIELLNPDVVIDPASIIVPSSAEPGSVVAVRWTVSNAGQGFANWLDLFTTPTWSISLSDDTVVGDADDVILSSFSLAIPGGNVLDPGESQVMTQNVTLPVVTGARYVIVRCDRNNNIPEGTAGEANNFSLDADPIAVQSLPNLRVPEESISVPSSVSVGQQIQVSWNVQNSGNGPASGTWTDEFLLSTDRLVGNDIALGSATFTGTLTAGQSYTAQRTITVPPEATGTLFFLVRTDTANVIVEVSETDNFGFDVDTLTGNRPDLVPQMVSAPSDAVLGQSFAVSWNDANLGTGQAIGTWFDRVVLSANDTYGDADDIQLASQAFGGPIAPAAAAPRSVDVTIGSGVAAGVYRIFVRTDSTDAIPESNELNNTSAGLMINVGGPDLAPSLTGAVVPTTGTIGRTYTVQFNEENIGNIAAVGSWSSQVVLSVDAVFGGADDIGATSVVVSGPLNPGASALRTLNVNVPTSASGVYNVMARSDISGAISEINEANNTLVLGQVTVGAPDLLPIAAGATFPSSAAAGQSVTVQWTERNDGNRDAGPAWSNRVVLSVNEIYGDADDVPGGTTAVSTPLAPGGSATRSVMFSAPAALSGSVFILARSDVSSQVAESNEANNTVTLGTMMLGGTPDLRLAATGTVVPPTAMVGVPFVVQYRVRNAGAVEAPLPWNERLVLSTNTIYGDADDIVPVVIASPGALAPGAEATRMVTMNQPAGLIHHWPGDGNANDIVGGQNGTISGAVAFADGARGQAFEFAGGEVTCANRLVGNFGTSDFTLAYWVRLTNTGSVEIISKRSTCNFGSFFDIRNGSFEMYADSGGTCNSGVSFALPSDGVWRHVAYSRQGTTMRAYLNGTLQTSRITACVANVGNLSNLRFSGGPCIGVDGTVRLAGGLDDVRIYSRALSEEEIRTVAGIAGLHQVALEPDEKVVEAEIAAPRGASGPLNVIVRLDSDGMVAESDESNNTAVLGSVIIGGGGTPDLAPEATSGASPSSATIGQQVFVQWQDRNLGTAPVAINWSDRVVFSINDIFGDADDAGAVTVNAIGPLAAGDTLPRSTTLTVPGLAAGTYRLLVRADFGGVVTELNESNNTATIGMVQVGVPDLSIASIGAPMSGVIGTPLNITWQASNIGSSGAVAPWTDRVWLSTDPTLGGDTLVGNVVRSMNLAPGASYDGAIAGTLPAAPGSYWVIVQLDVLGQVPEGGAEANNVQAFGPITVTPPPGPDLVVTQITAPPSATAGSTVTAVYTVTNSGTEPASVNWQDAIYLSTDAALDGADQQVRLSPANQAPLAPGASYSFSRNISLPLSFDDATLYVIVRTDQGGAVSEQSESNNTLASSPIAVAGAPGPDLVASNAGAPSAATFGSTIAVSWRVNNAGTAPAESPWSDAVFLSSDAVFGTTDRLIGSRPYSGAAIPPGGPGYDAAASIQLPVDQTTLPGTYFILVRADGFGGVNETNENNNVTAFGPITINLPPLPNARVVQLSAPADAAVGLPFNVSFRIENAGPEPATGSWLNEIRLVRQSGTGENPIVAVTEFSGTIAPGALSPVQTASFLLPDIGDTAFNVSVETNINRSLLEASTADNRAESSPASVYRRPDLRAASVMGPATGTADSTISVTYAIANDGPAAVLPFWIDAVYLSSDAAAGNDILLGTNGEASTLGVGGTYMRTISFPVPGTLEGQFFLVVETDRGNRVIESGGVSANNFAVAVSPITISQPPRPNLVVEAVTPPTPGLSGAPMPVSWTVRNTGLGAAAGFWTDRVFVSADRTLSPDDVALNDFSNPNPLGPGESYTLTRSLFYPSAPGEYFLIVSTDALKVVNEGISGGENDNITASLTPLTVATFTATATASIESAPAGTPVTITGVASVEGRGGVAVDVPVVVRANVGGFERRLIDRTDDNGEYSVVFQPGPTEGGLYNVAAGPEHAIGLAPTDSFSLWSLVPQPSAAFVTANPMLVSNGQFTLRNPGNQAQSGLSAVITGVPSGVNVQVEINPGGAPAIGPNSTVPIAYSVLADQEIVTPFVVGVEVTSEQGAVARFELNLRVFPAQPALALVQDGLISGRLSKNLLRGERAYAQFEVQNLGTGATGPLTIVLPPALDWMRAATPSPLPSLGPGQRASVVLQLDPPAGLPLAVFAGSLAVNGASTGLTVPFRFTMVSEGVGDLLVRATDEFTYYAEGMPRVEGASVTVKQNGTGIIVAAGLTKENGEIRFDGLTEAYYDLEVTAPDHGTFRTTILVGGGDVTNVEAFMPRQLVRYTWTVTPTDFIDTYTIRIQATFQTQVPAPVVVVEPSYVDLNNIPLPTQINYTITNHGLIAAPNLRFNVGESDLFELVPLVDTFGTLPGMSSVEVPVLVLPKGGARGGATGAERSGCGAAVSFACFDLMCGSQTYTYCAPTIAATGNCSSGPGGGDGGGGGGIGPGGGSGGPSGGGGQGTADSFIYPPIVSQPVGCDPCLIKCVFSGLGCVPGLGCGAGLAGGCGFPKVGTTGKIISTVAGCLGAAVNCGVNLTPIAGQLSCACSVLRDCGLCQLSGPDVAGLFPCSPGDIISSLGSGIGGAIDGRGVLPPTTGIPIVDYYYRLYYAYMYRYFVLAEIFGDAKWILLDENNTEEFDAFLGAFALASDEKGPSGLRISEAERAALLASPRPYQITEADVDAFIARWNRSLDYYDLGIMADDQLPAGWNPDFINAVAVEQASTFAYDVEQEAVGQQFENIIDAINYAREVLYRSVVPAVGVASSRGGGEGVCAEVRIQLDQTLTLTRTAFTARLELENQSDAPLEAIAIDVLIRDESGVDATSRFGIFPPEMTGGLTGVDGTGTLPGMTTGASAWTILPTDEAAPLVPTRYYVSGVLSYATDGQVLTIPLFPIVITVQPDPSLQLNYFLETVVYADDPFTPELEPSIPFSLGLIVKNNGAGIARNLSITSAQPEIVENDRGLLIDFDIIGTQVGLEQIAPSLTVNLGDIGPDETNVARWLMICSLQGEFTGYSASFEHVTGLGDPRLSLIESVDIFGLNHVVRDVRPAADALPDFLTNDFPDPRNLPDTLHLSTGAVADIDTDVNATTTLGPAPQEATFDADSGPGWNYYRVPDPFDASLRLRGARRSDGSMLLFPDNVWQTSRINRLLPGSPVERFIHVFDYAGDGQYTLVFDPDSIAPTVLAAKSVHTHGSGVGEVGLDIDPDSTFTEPRGGGFSTLLYTFSEPIEADTFTQVNVVVDGFNADGTPVDLSGVSEVLTLNKGDTVGRVVFDPPLPPRARYCIQLVGVTDRAGNPIFGDGQRLDIIVLPGDASGDARVNPTDTGGVGSLVGTNPISPAALYQVRSDMNLDGRIDTADVDIVLANRRADLRTTPNACLVLFAGDPTARQPDKTIAGDPTGLNLVGGEPGNPTGGPTLGPTDGAPNGSNDLDAAALAGSTRRLAYEFAGQQSVLAFDDQMIAVFDAAAADDVPALLGDYGIDPASIHPWPIDGWWTAALPKILSTADAKRELQRVIEQSGARVAPVLRDDAGSMVIPSGTILVRFKAGVPDAWARQVIEQSAGAGAAIDPAFAGVDGLYTVKPVNIFGESALELAAKLADRKDVDFAETEMLFASLTDRADDEAEPPAFVEKPDLAVLGDAASAAQLGELRAAAADLSIGGPVADAVRVLRTRDGLCAGSTAELALALHAAAERGGRVALLDLNLPFGSKAVADVLARIQSLGVTTVVPERAGLLGLVPGVVRASEGVSAARLAVIINLINSVNRAERDALLDRLRADPALAAVRASLPGARRTGDLNADGVVSLDDALRMLAAWGTPDSPADLNADGVVGADDLNMLLEAIANPPEHAGIR